MSVTDPLRWRFGASSHRYRLGPPLAEHELLTFESEQRVVLPDDYRRFLLEVGNGGAGPSYGLRPLDAASPPGLLRQPFPLTDAWSQSSDDDDEIPSPYFNGWLTLSDLGCGYSSFLVVTGPAAGTVWNDFLAGDGGLRPTGHTFASWYQAWLWPHTRAYVPPLRSAMA